MLKYSDRRTCRCCGSSDLVEYLDLGEQPLANSYVKDAASPCPTVPLRVNLCPNCFHSQLGAVVDPSTMFGHYLYVSGTTETFRRHTRLLAEEAVMVLTQRPGHRPSSEALVLDVACNDGTLLGHFRDLGCQVRGIDPAANLRQYTHAKGIEVDVAFFGRDAGVSYATQQRRFDVITAQNVFAHVDDAEGFLAGVKAALKEDGFAVIEFPYGRDMIAHNEFDTIYHEHLSYFLVNSFSRLARRAGFGIFKMTQTPIHGGSIRFYLAAGEEHAPQVEQMIRSEKDAGLLETQTYRDFASRVAENRQDMRSLLARLRAKGRPIIGYGASAKGNTMLNYFQVDLQYTVDDNPMKWGLLTPGRHVPIADPKRIAGENHPAIVVLAWNFLDEIKRRVAGITDKPRSFVLYVPDVRIEEA
ncbi:MAG TPA: class I SAM-dependent methyltransferase [Tepidisphaeraceae bacterium]|jgi:SAM-dependent methyltransferase|nr:class I SAM-dependent methyltransferase [Tepidisphaeraceae bacterium]